MIEPQTFYPEPEPPKTAGEMLAFARKGWDLSVEDVASNLNLGVAVINALERDQYDLLPGHTFVKGYIRSLCHFIAPKAQQSNQAYCVASRICRDNLQKHAPTTKAQGL